MVSRTGEDDRAAEASTSVGAADGAADRHIAVAVPIRAVERNRRVAASVLAGGFAYRLFLWLLPFGLVVGGALGLSDANSTEDAVERGGLPGAVTNAIGDASRAAQSDSWWLLAVGVPLLLWAGYSGREGGDAHSLARLGRASAEDEAAQGVTCLHGHAVRFVAAVALTWWLRDDWPGFLAPVITVRSARGALAVGLPHLPHRDAPWRRCCQERSSSRSDFGAPRGDRRLPRAEARQVDLPVRRSRRHGDVPLLHVRDGDSSSSPPPSQQLALRRARRAR